MFVSFVGMLFNIPLDYALIYGWWIFPEMGILGAALATVFSWLLIVVVYSVLIFDRQNISRFNLAGSKKLDRDLMGRLIKFGLPGSLQFSLDVFAFTFFVFMVGRLGAAELAINNIVLSIESIAFMPALGFSIGLSTLAGQALGKNDVNLATKVTRQTIHILGAYILVLVLVLTAAPQWILALFMDADTPAYFSLGITLMRIMSIYIIFDGLYMVYIGLLKGAGDTRFHHACHWPCLPAVFSHTDLCRGYLPGGQPRHLLVDSHRLRHLPLRRLRIPLSAGPLEIHTCH
jgi:MATE family multidrug resistance protein